MVKITGLQVANTGLQVADAGYRQAFGLQIQVACRNLRVDDRGLRGADAGKIKIMHCNKMLFPMICYARHGIFILSTVIVSVIY